MRDESIWVIAVAALGPAAALDLRPPPRKRDERCRIQHAEELEDEEDVGKQSFEAEDGGARASGTEGDGI
jgi:hypothetical protein